MHELSVADSLVRTVLAELKGKEFISVKEVIVEVGEFTFVGLEQLKFAYKVITEGTPLEGSSMTIMEKKGEVECRSCNYSGPVKRISEKEEWHYSAPILSCPECGKTVAIVKGEDVIVKNIVLEVED